MKSSVLILSVFFAADTLLAGPACPSLFRSSMPPTLSPVISSLAQLMVEVNANTVSGRGHDIMARKLQKDLQTKTKELFDVAQKLDVDEKELKSRIVAEVEKYQKRQKNIEKKRADEIKKAEQPLIILNPKLVQTFDYQYTIRKLATSPDGRFVVAAPEDGALRLISTKDWKEAKVLKNGKSVPSGKEQHLKLVQFSPDGKYLISFWKNSTARIYETTNYTEVHSLESFYLESLSVSPDSRYLVLSKYNGAVEVIEMGTWDNIKKLEFEKPIHSSILTPDGKYLISTLDARRAIVSKFGTWEQVHDFEHNSFGPNSAPLLLDQGRLMVTVTGNGFNVIEVDSGQIVHTINHRSGGYHMTLSADQKKLVTYDREGSAIVTEVGVWNEIGLVQTNDSIFRAYLTKDNLYLVVQSSKDSVRIFNWRGDPKELHVIKHNSEVMASDVSQDGQFVITSTRNGKVYVTRLHNPIE